MSRVSAELDEAAAQLREMRKLVAVARKAVMLEGGRGEGIGEILAAAHNVAGNPGFGKQVWTKVDALVVESLAALETADRKLQQIAALHKAAVSALEDAEARRKHAARGLKI